MDHLKAGDGGTGVTAPASAVCVAAAPKRRPILRHDLVAGLTVALMSIPQGMAYAVIAGLPPVYGLYSSIVLTMVFALCGSSRYLVSGPTNAVSIMVASVSLAVVHPLADTNPMGVVVLLTFMVGSVQLLLGLLKVGNLSQFISNSVLMGYTAGAGLLIALNQCGPLLGVASVDRGRHLLVRIGATLAQLPQANGYAALLGCGTVVLLLAGRRWRPHWPTPLLVMILTAAVAGLFGLEERGVPLVGHLSAVLPRLEWPPFQIGLVADLGSAAIAVALLGCIESLSIAKRIGMVSGRREDSNRDFIGLGLSHMLGSLFQCMPGGGSLTRSMLNYTAGARTRCAGVFSALWVAVILLLFGRWARFIPMASLAGLLVVLGLGLIDVRRIRYAVMATRSDAAVLGATFLATLLLHLDTAIYVGVLSSLALFLRKASAPHLVEYNLQEDILREISDPKERMHPAISIIHVEGELFFGAAEIFEDQMRRLVSDGNIRVVILRLKNARHLDATTLAALEGLYRYLEADGRLLLISGASPDVLRVLRRGGLLKVLGAANVFPAEGNLTAATGKALLRAQAFVGKATTPDLRVFYDSRHAPDIARTGAKMPDANRETPR